MKKRTLSVILCVALALILLTACSSKKEELSPPMPTPIIIYVTPEPASAEPTAAPDAAVTPEAAKTPAPTAAPAPETPAPTPAPTGTPVPAPPKVTKSPTDEYVSEGGTCLFVARADNASNLTWYFVSPDGGINISYDAVYSYFPWIGVSGGNENTLRISNVPYGMNGWRVYCRFGNGVGTTSSGYAVVSVSPAVTPAPAGIATEPVIEPDYGGYSDYSTDYSGYYTSGRAEMYVDGGPGNYYVTVNWPGSAFETATWTFSGSFDSDGTMRFYDCSKTINTYYEDGTSDFMTDYTDAGGILSITGAGGLRLEIFGDWDISGTVFQ